MKIVKVCYSKLVSDGKTYGNQTVGCEAVVEPGESAHVTLDKARVWVEEELAGLGASCAKPVRAKTEMENAADVLRQIASIISNPLDLPF